MQIKCEFCGSYIDDQSLKCPNCGAPNNGVKRVADGIPKTIDELISYCMQRDIPYHKLHFRLGEDSKEPKVFGIFKDSKTGNFVVYKNKSQGQRAVRYSGKDEAYAVNEIYQKLREIKTISKGSQISKSSNKNKVSRSNVNDAQKYYDAYHDKRINRRSPRKRSYGPRFAIKILACYMIFVVAISFITTMIPFIPSMGKVLHNNGAYIDNVTGDAFYKIGNDFYYYDDYDDSWYSYDVEDDWDWDNYSYEYGDYNNFYDTTYYQDYQDLWEDSYEWEDDYDWDDDDSYDDWDDDYDWDYDYDYDYDYDWDSDW